MSKFENIPSLNPDKMGRRSFLKDVTAGVVIASTGATIKLLKSNKDDESNPEFVEQPVENKKQEVATEKQEEIENEDVKSVGEILSYDNKEEIEINENVINKTTEYWKKKYDKGGKMHQDFITAYEDMQEWKPQLENIFQEEGVRKEYIYLAIPESYWQLKSKSSAGARGPYQLMFATAKNFGCQNSKEMEDPLKSARACAKYLKYLYDKFGDWDLALSGYNGGYIWQYKKQEKEEISYPNFLKYAEAKIKEKRKRAKGPSVLHEVKKDDTIWKLTREYKIKDADILFNNKPTGNNIRIGQQLTILIKSEETKKIVFEKSVRDFAENLNYPAKFNAVIELIEEMEDIELIEEMEDNKNTQLVQADKM